MSSSNPRPVNVSYLVVGLIFLGISGSWALQASGTVDTAQVQWLLPLVLVGAGIVGLVAFAAKGLSRDRRGDEQAPDAGFDAGFDPYSDTTDVIDQSDDTEVSDQTLTIEGDDR
jgi:hypothetical protein